jgi:hypothetical protein
MMYVQLLFCANAMSTCLCRYFHMLPFLLVRRGTSAVLGVLAVVGIEILWNIFPPGPLPSATLLLLHIVVLTVLWFSGALLTGGAEGEQRVYLLKPSLQKKLT